MRTGKRRGDETVTPVASKVARITKDTDDHATSESAQSSGRPTLAEQFHLKIRIRSRKKAKQNDPKPVTQPDTEKGTNPAEQPETAKAQDRGDDSDDEYLMAEDQKKGQPAPDGDRLQPLNVGYLGDKQAEYDEFTHLPWLESMEVIVTCHHPLINEIRHRSRVGFCGAKLVRRKKIRGAFYEQMVKPYEEPTLLAFDLFDRYGRLKDDYKHHEIKKGSGRWQQQLDDGDILLIEDITVEEHYRRQGLATAMVKTLFEAARRKTEDGKFIAILWPDSSKDDHFRDILKFIVSEFGNLCRAKILDHYDPIAIPWARSLGFRRIGASMWFGLSCQEGSTISISPIEDDHDPPPFDRVVEKLLPNSIQSASSDKKFLAAVQKHYRHVENDDQRWLATDEEGNTLLHLAALYFFPGSVAWIMLRPCSSPLLEMHNSSGNTPLEALLQRLEIMRTRSLTGNDSIMIMSDKFDGHTKEQAKCIALLKEIDIDSDEDLEQFRYGCTCGDCYDGYISPRMNYALYMKACSESDRLAEELDEMSGAEWVESNEWGLLNLPGYCLKYLEHYKAIRKGLVKVCEQISNCLLERLVPDEDNIKLIMAISEDDHPDMVKRFFKCGGNIAGVVGLILEKATWDDEIYGNGWLLADIEDDEDFDEPVCRNDHDFALVARKCGYPAVAKWLTTVIVGPR